MWPIFKKWFSTPARYRLSKYGGQVKMVNAMEAEFEAMEDGQLRAMTETLRERLKNGASLEEILPAAFGAVREVSKRALGQRPYDVQLMGGIVLNEGNIAEMKTGEGKTLVATLPSYLNVLGGKSVHIVTVNDYLARRDEVWMGGIFHRLGVKTGCITSGMSLEEKKKAYEADVMYGTNNEFGFDYLRDNMALSEENRVQRGFDFAIVDEVDSILVDEARTPLIISGPAEDHTDLYKVINDLVRKLVREDYVLDEKQKSVILSDGGVEKAQKWLGEKSLLRGDDLYDYENVQLMHHINQSLRAHTLFKRDKDYIVRQNAVVIIDEFTGRMMPGRRFSGGLHQALEAKERVSILKEQQTLSSITFQNYFRLYEKLAGMTGTAATEAEEFSDIYNLSVVEIPTHRPMIRADLQDQIYRTKEEKQASIIGRIKEIVKTQQPLLVGTASIEQSDYFSSLLEKEGLVHEVLNARNHEKEAFIIAQAGRKGALTIATNMAGRGTDIQLGGNEEMLMQQLEEGDEEARERLKEQVATEKEEVIKLGGLYILGTERHESRRIDNQLRGRSGRQGDPGKTCFFLSLEDDLMRVFGSEKLENMLKKLGWEKGESLAHPWISRSLEKAQEKIENRNYDIRKTLLKYDNVLNEQRTIVYQQRREMMQQESVEDIIADIKVEVVENLWRDYVAENPTGERLNELKEVLRGKFNVVVKEACETAESLKEFVTDEIDRRIVNNRVLVGQENMGGIERSFLLQVVDRCWKDHMYSLEMVRQSVGLRAYGQKNPLSEYRKEAFHLFEKFLQQVRERILQILLNISIQKKPVVQAPSVKKVLVKGKKGNPQQRGRKKGRRR